MTLDDTLYRAFITVCHDHYLHFFDQEERAQEHLLDDIAAYHADDFDASDPVASLENVLESARLTTRPRFRAALLRQLADPFYSIYAACVAVVEPSDAALRSLKRRLRDLTPPLPAGFPDTHLRPFAIAWIQALLDRAAFDPEIPDPARYQANRFYKATARGTKIPRLESLLERYGGIPAAQVEYVRTQLYEVLTSQDTFGNAHLIPGQLSLRLGLDATWHQCRSCGLTQIEPVFGRCSECESAKLVPLAPDDAYMTARNGYIREPLRTILGSGSPMHLVAEEHTAQLSMRDQGAVYATTEEYELRFQDVLVAPANSVGKPPVDVLSCTTTMEVGIDIGSLTAVGLRNVPPQRENYQQRAGRSGRRGSAVSTVITYAQDGPHDFFYFSQPAAIISGAPREAKIKTDNPRLAARHVNAHLIQTFFHDTLDRLGQVTEDQIAGERTHIMSALGDARDFLLGSGDFSLVAFREWVAANAGSPGAPLTGAIAAWVPDAVAEAFGASSGASAGVAAGATGTPGGMTKETFVIRTGREFVAALDGLAREALQPPVGSVAAATGGVAAVSAPTDDAEDEGLLLNLLFERGLLPRYAFPTDLCSFHVYDTDGSTKEKPQQSKEKALSEYAPGRQLVIDKRSYRVGGIVSDDPRVLNAGEALFAAPLSVYVYCPRCTHVEVRSVRGAEPRVCRVCTTPLAECEMVDPPSFSPERGLPLRDTDQGQETSYATDAQFPTPVRAVDLAWSNGPGPHLRFAYEENQELVIANKGPKDEGFKICQTCGAAWPSVTAPTSERHERPYLLTEFHRRAGITRDCMGVLTPEAIYLGHKFRTDILLVQVALHAPLAYAPNSPWLQDALLTTAQALTLAASRRLDIDPGELAAGYRLVPASASTPEALAGAELYLYDTSAGGAGYAAEAGDCLNDILVGALLLVQGCPERCQRSCTKCLRHYGNRLDHPRLDRHLAAQFLTYATTGAMPAVAGIDGQADDLMALARYLELEGWSVTCDRAAGRPLGVQLPGGVAWVGTYPALLDDGVARAGHPVVAAAGHVGQRACLLNDYTLTRDLPSAYQLLRRAISG